MADRPASPERRKAGQRAGGQRPGKPADRARRLAFDALRAVNGDGAFANLVLGRLLDERRLSARDAAFATELVAGTCRRQGTYDLVLERASGRPLGSLQPAVVDILRLGTHQLLGMRVPAHAAVGASVDLAAASVGQRVRGLVNAILRKVAERDDDGWLTELTDGLGEREALAVRYAHPRWIVDAFAQVLPAGELVAALAADNVSPVPTLAVRPGLADVAELIEAGATPGRWSPYAAVWSGNPAALPPIAQGRAGVQDEGSQLVTWGLTRPSADPGSWLDLCSGPGGKSALLAGLAAERGGRLLSAELNPHRAALVAAALRAYPGPRPVVVVADGTRPAWRSGSFTRVLADVPCTGLGALRRRPEARWRRAEADLDALVGLQEALLDSALDAAAPGGLVAYVTCSPHPRETVGIVRTVLARRDAVSVVPAEEVLPGIPGSTAGPFLQLWPHRHGTDAMFAAYLRRG
ncbi:MAG TPA: transcription antitermination factor NusB [Microlunatus sp.]|nr:transcription antitermination factor NusB [Microlunatus sp.]